MKKAMILAVLFSCVLWGRAVHAQDETDFTQEDAYYAIMYATGADDDAGEWATEANSSKANAASSTSDADAQYIFWSIGNGENQEIASTVGAADIALSEGNDEMELASDDFTLADSALATAQAHFSLGNYNSAYNYGSLAYFYYGDAAEHCENAFNYFEEAISDAIYADMMMD